MPFYSAPSCLITIMVQLNNSREQSRLLNWKLQVNVGFSIFFSAMQIKLINPNFFPHNGYENNC